VSIDALQAEAVAEEAPAAIVETEPPPGPADLPAPDQAPAVEPPADVESAEDLGIMVAPPALEALPTDFMMDAPPETEPAVIPEAAAVVEVAPAAETAPVVAQNEPAPAPRTASDSHESSQPVCEEILPAAQAVPPQVAAPPAKKRRRTALALG
jgi:hypothetical protein